MANPLAITLHDGPEAASGAAEPIDCGSDRTIGTLTLHVSELTGEGATFDLWVDSSIGTYNWNVVATAKQALAPRSEWLFAFFCERYLRVRWQLSDGAEATFRVSGEANQTYINKHDLEQSMPANMFEAMPPEVLAHAALDATDEAAGYLRHYYAMPLTAWGHDLRLFVGKMAFYHAMCRRGYNPDHIDEMIRKGYEDALAWLKGAASSSASIIDSSPGVTESGGYCVSGPPRGWYPPL